MQDCRILALDGDWSLSGPGWRIDADRSDGGLVLPDAVLIDAESQIDESVLDRLALPLIVAVGEGAVTPAPRWLDRADAWLLPGDDAETIGTIAARLLRPAGAAGVAEVTTTTEQLSALSADARRIAEALATLAQATTAEAPTPVSAALVRRLIRLRRDRDRHFPAELFADPAWDMLLDLAAARLEGTDVSVSSLCVAAAVPTTTALRWVRSLSEAGIVQRHTDPVDRRRSFVRLSDQAHDAMLAWLRRFGAVFALR